jgi:N-acetylglucosamine-6-phosphate deacetylase
MLTQIINGKIFTPQGWLDEGSVLMRDNKILEVTNCDLALIGANLIDAKGMYIVPGFVCMHAHGGGGHDFTECTEEAFRTAVKAHQKHGATSIFPTLSSSPFSEIRKAVSICEKLMKEKDSPVLGLHVEGPYLNPKMAGGQFAGKVKNPDKEEYTSLLDETNCIKRWDSSPELPGALEFAGYLRSKGLPFLIPKPNMTVSKLLMKPDILMRLIFTMQCRDFINAVNISMKERWKVSI